MRKITLSACLVALLTATSFFVNGQDSANGQELAAIQQKLVSEYTLTQPTAANDDIVTPGAVLVLEKGPLIMVDASSSVNPYHNTYKDGKIQNPAAKAKSWRDKLSAVPGVSSLPGGNAPATRTFVPGEKVWVTKIDVRSGEIVFDLFTDAYKDSSGNDVRYKTSVTFPFPKGWHPKPDQVDKFVAEVFKVQPADDAKKDDKQTPAAEPQPAPTKPGAVTPATTEQTSEAPPPPIAPPPPPPADPKTISAGQTPDQVTAALGQPEKIIKLPTKQIYIYKDMKVTFINGKVTDVQ